MPFDASIRPIVDSINDQVSFSEEYFDSLYFHRENLKLDTNGLLNDMHAKAFKLHEKAIAIIEKRIVYDTCPHVYEKMVFIATIYLSSLNSLNETLKNDDLDNLNQKVRDYCRNLKDFTFEFFVTVPKEDQSEYSPPFLGPCGA